MDPRPGLRARYVRAEKEGGGATIGVVWGYDLHDITLTPRNWSRVKRGKPLRIRERGVYEGVFQWEYWNFEGGLDGDLLVQYGDDGGVGFVGKLRDAYIEEVEPLDSGVTSEGSGTQDQADAWTDARSLIRQAGLPLTVQSYLNFKYGATAPQPDQIDERDLPPELRGKPFRDWLDSQREERKRARELGQTRPEEWDPEEEGKAGAQAYSRHRRKHIFRPQATAPSKDPADRS